MIVEDVIRKVLVNNIDTDNLWRAKRAFSGYTDEMMNKQYGNSGETCKAILEGYQKSVDNAEELVVYFDEMCRRIKCSIPVDPQ